jgi:RNA polymerase sigma-70 factor (ECF subfamily)
MEGIARDAVTAPGIVDAAAAGDAIAFARLVAAYHADMIRVAYVVSGGDHDAADDAVQAAWAVAWQKLSTVRHRDRVRSWLVAVAANEARRLGRQRRMTSRVRDLADAEAHASDPHAPDPAERSDVLDLELALHHLTADERTLLALRYEAGLDSSEIGSVLGRPSATIRWRLARIVGRLRKELCDA